MTPTITVKLGNKRIREVAGHNRFCLEVLGAFDGVISTSYFSYLEDAMREILTGTGVK